jgi:hypothetical protein
MMSYSEQTESDCLSSDVSKIFIFIYFIFIYLLFILKKKKMLIIYK